jgi:uncharacterized Fe-S cluster protein YjdI
MLRVTTVNDLTYYGTVTELCVKHKTELFRENRKDWIPNNRNKIYEFRRQLETARGCLI